jgi:hypothetical protein
MTVTRAIAATAMLAGLAVGAAGPAWADPQDPHDRTSNQMSGHYIKTSTASNGQTATDDWYVTPCGDGCASVSVGTAPGGQPFGQARLVNGQWTLDTVAHAVCADGTDIPNALSVHYTWDANSLAGSAQTTAKVPECGQAAGYQQTNTVQLRQAP